MHNISLFGIDFNIDPVAFSFFGKWDIYWYGIIITTGVLLAFLYGMKNGNRLGINPDHIFNAFIIVLPVSILAARSYYIIFDPDTTFADFFGSGGKGFSGLAIYGGVIGAAITIFIVQRIYKFNVLAALDITSIGFLIGQGIGRWGNFVNQEAYGTFTGSGWFGMTGDKIAAQTGNTDLVHPCFLYESIWCILGFFVLHYFSKRRKYKGQIALMYGAWYGFERTFIEMLRTDSLLLGNTGIRVSSLLSALLFISCVTVLILMHKKAKTKQFNEEYVSVFEDVKSELEKDKNEDDVEIIDNDNESFEDEVIEVFESPKNKEEAIIHIANNNPGEDEDSDEALDENEDEDIDINI